MSPEDILSPREIEIASAYAQGDTYQAIAARLGIAPSTVRTHLATIYRKLEVSSKLELHSRLGGALPTSEMLTDHAAVISDLALSLEESLRREQALAEVLRIISRSRGDIDAVMSSILGFALDLCEAEFGILFDYRGEVRGQSHTGHPCAVQGLARHARHLHGQPAHWSRPTGDKPCHCEHL